MSKLTFSLAMAMSLSLMSACSAEDPSEVEPSAVTSQPEATVTTLASAPASSMSTAPSSTVTEPPSPTTVAESGGRSVSRAIAPLRLDDPDDLREFLSGISEEERSCLEENDIGLRVLSRVAESAPGSSPPGEAAVVIGCLQDETILRLFITSLVGLADPLTPETSGCIREGLVSIDLHEVLSPPAENEDPVNSLGLGMAALSASVACMTDDEWNAYAPNLGMQVEDRESVACLFERLGGPEALVEAMQKAAAGEASEDLFEMLEACRPVTSPDSAAVDESGGRGGSLIWSFATGGWDLTAPAVADGVVYFGADDGSLYALSAPSGELVWSFSTDDPIRSIPTVSDGTVYFGADDNHLYALDAATGAELWRYDTGYPIRYSPAVGDGLIYFPARTENDRAVHAVDAATGTLVWVAEHPYPVDERLVPSVHGARVYAQGADYGTFYALDAATGETAWQAEVGGYVESAPSVLEGVVYLTVINQAYAFDEVTGELVWSVNTEEFPARDFPALLFDGVYYLAPGEHMRALDADTGDEIWSYQTGELSSAPVVAGGALIGGSAEAGRLFALDALTGDLMWTLSTDDATNHALSVVDKVLYGQTSEGYLFAVDAADPDDGSILPWSFEIGWFDDAPRYTVNKGVVYSGGPDNRFYAHEAPTAHVTVP